EICNRGWHTYCIVPPLAAIPDGLWLCPQCTAEGKTEADAAKAAEQRDELEAAQQQPNLFPDAAMRRRDNAAAKLQGRLVSKLFKDSVTNLTRLYWGRLHYRGALERPHYFMVQYNDGDSE